MKEYLVARAEEVSILQAALQSSESELVAVLGRRRVGKTFLVRHTYAERMAFEMMGTENAELSFQLQSFAYQLSLQSGQQVEPPKDWLAAFFALINYLKTLDRDKKHVIFFDELPWLATPRSNFLNAFSFFWNSWAETNNVVVVICGSATSWMIKRVINHRGGLHNRVTKRLFLQPFTLGETERFLRQRGIDMPRLEVMRLYMVFGGIPHYLKQIRKGQSVSQTIDELCYSINGTLRDEFERLYLALFDSPERHMAIVRALASRRYGMRRKELLEAAGLSGGGGATRVLNDLERSGFITSSNLFAEGSKNLAYRLIDEYSLFYLRFLESARQKNEKGWSEKVDTPGYHAWNGYAFENIGFRHIPQIKQALGISGVRTRAESYLARATQEASGVQIDMLLDRADNVINICEFKFSAKDFTLPPAEARKLAAKVSAFRSHTNTRKQLFLTLVVPFVEDAVKVLHGVDALILADDLFS